MMNLKSRATWLIAVLLLLNTWVFQAQEAIEADFVGTLDNETPFIEFPLRVPITGSTVIIDMARTSGDLDTLVYLVDDKGSIVASNDDRAIGVGEAPSSDSLLIFPQASAGQYRIIATRFKVVEGESSGDFRILIDIEAPVAAVDFQVRRGDLLNTGFPIEIEARERAPWTVLAYYGGDNNLEAGVLHDLKEFEAGGGGTPNAHIVAMVDRSPDYAQDDGDWQETRVYEISAGVNPLGDPIILDSTPLGQFNQENLDLSDGEIFAQFLVWGVQNFPAERYIVAFASHGDGWKGVTADDSPLRLDGEIQRSTEFSLLTLPELSQAFELATNAAEVDRFALLINDACLMGSAEYFAAIAPYFEYTLASPEIVVNPALDMSILTRTLGEQGAALDVQALGKNLVDYYMDVDVPARGAADTVYLTNALFDLSQFDSLVSDIEAFAEVVNRNPVVRGQELGKIRRNVYTYTAFSGFNDKIDLGDLMRDLLIETQDDEMITAAERVLEALNRSVVYGKAGSAVEGVTSFFNIYFPDDQDDFDSKYFDETPLKEWSRMLRSYYNSFNPQPWTGGGSELSFHAPLSPKLKITTDMSSTFSIIDRPQLGYEIIGRNLAKGQLTVDRVLPDGTSVRVFTDALVQEVLDEQGNVVRLNIWEDGVTPYDAFWRAHLPVVTDGVNSAPELMTFTERVAYLDGRYREQGSDLWNSVTVSFDIETRQYQRTINRSEGAGGVAVIEIPVGAEFQTFSLLVSADGALTPVDGNTYIWPQDGLTWNFEPAPTGNYNIGIEVSAFGGTSSFETVRVNVDNDGLPSNLRGDKDNFGGFNIPLDIDWTPIVFNSDAFLYESFSPDQQQSIKVYLAPRPEDNQVSAIAESIISNYGLTRSSDNSPLSISGFEAVSFDYSYEGSAGAITGRMFVYFNPTVAGGFGLAIAAEVSADVSEQLEALYQQILLSTIFDSVQRSGDWRGTDVNDFASSRIRVDWLESDLPNGWKRYESPQDANVFIETGTIQVSSEVAGNNNVLSNFVTGRVAADVDNLTITGNQIYYGENLQWQASIYEGMHNGNEVTGRVYVTTIADQVYSVWVEAPKGDLALDVFPNIFEVFVDTYRIFIE